LQKLLNLHNHFQKLTMVGKMINELIIKTLPLVPKSMVYIFAKKYIAGETLADAVRVTQDFAKLGGKTTIDVLGEFVRTKERALHEREECTKVIDAIVKNNLPTYLSIKPTSLGLDIDFNFCYESIKYLGKIAKEKNVFIRIDMENSPYTSDTLKIYRMLRDEGFDNFGFVIQSYMRRSMDDLKAMVEYKPNVRLCKGIYVESESIAYKDREEIRENYKKLLVYMFENGFYPAIATHDEPLIQFAENYIRTNKIDNSQYEFQMLLGVRENRRNELLKLGHNVRIYVPYGEDWYGYSTRRLKENPQIAGHIVKAIFGIS
jgi:proline dehydrogenase